MNRRQFVQTSLLGASVMSKKMQAAVGPKSDDEHTSAAASTAKLFPNALPEFPWQQFSAAGFDEQVAGTIYSPGKAPCCGVPLGGISTGCIDLDVKGVYGFSSIFNGWSHWPHGIAVEGSRMARKPPSLQPLLGLAVDGQTWVLTAGQVVKGGDIGYCRDPD